MYGLSRHLFGGDSPSQVVERARALPPRQAVVAVRSSIVAGLHSRITTRDAVYPGGIKPPVDSISAMGVIDDLRSSGLVGEDVIRRSRVEHEHELAASLIREATSRSLPTVSLEYRLDSAAQARIVKDYPEFQIKFTGKVLHHHGVAAVARRLNQFLILRRIRGPYIDIGGNLMSNLGCTAEPCHVIQPVLSARDAVRVSRDLNRLSDLVNSHAWSLSSLLALRGYVKMANSVCRNVFETCGFQCRTAVSVDSAYDIHPEHFMKAMANHGVVDAYLTFMVAPEALLVPVGELADLGARYQVVWRDNPSVSVAQRDLLDTECWAELDILFYFSNDPSTAYRHRFDVYAAWLALPASCVVGRHSYSVEFLSVRLSTVLVHIYRVADGLFHEVVPRPYFLGRYDDYLIVSGYCASMYSTARPLELSVLLIEKKVWADLLCAAAQTQSSTVTPEDMLSKVRSLSASMSMKVIVNGTNIATIDNTKNAEVLYQMHALLVAYATHSQCKQRQAMQANIATSRKQALWSDVSVASLMRLSTQLIVYAVRRAIDTLTPWLCVWDIAGGYNALVGRLCSRVEVVVPGVIEVPAPAPQWSPSSGGGIVGVPSVAVATRELFRGFCCWRAPTAPIVVTSPGVTVYYQWCWPAVFALAGSVVGLAALAYYRRRLRDWCVSVMGVRSLRVLRGSVVGLAVCGYTATAARFLLPQVATTMDVSRVCLGVVRQLTWPLSRLVSGLLVACRTLDWPVVDVQGWLPSAVTTLDPTAIVPYLCSWSSLLAVVGQCGVVVAASIYDVASGGFAFDGVHVVSVSAGAVGLMSVVCGRVVADCVFGENVVSALTRVVIAGAAVNLFVPIRSPRTNEIVVNRSGLAAYRDLVDVVDPIRVVRVWNASDVLVVRGGVINVAPHIVGRQRPPRVVLPVLSESDYLARLSSVAAALNERIREAEAEVTDDAPVEDVQVEVVHSPDRPMGVASRLLGGLTHFFPVAEVSDRYPWALAATPDAAERIDNYFAVMLRLDVDTVRLYVPPALSGQSDETRLSVIEYGTATYCALVGAGVAIRDYLLSAMVGKQAENRPNVREVAPKFGDGQVYYQKHPDGSGELIDDKLYDADGGPCYTSDALEFFHALHVVRRLDSQRVVQSLASPSDLRIVMVQGVPGCGKTTLVVQTAIDGDLIVTETKAAERELRERLDAANKGGIEVRTSASVIINLTERRCKRMLIDEATLIHAGLVRVIAAVYGVELVVAFGDYQQISAVSFVPDLSFHHEVLRATDIVMADVTYRLPQDAVHCLRTIYPLIQTTSLVERSITWTTELDVNQEALYITFTQLDKAELVRAGIPDGKLSGSGRRVLTAHEAQGQSVPHVVVVRLTIHQLPIFKLNRGRLNPHMIVALSRHTSTLRLYSKATDDDLRGYLQSLPPHGPSELPLRLDGPVPDVAAMLRSKLKCDPSMGTVLTALEDRHTNDCWWQTAAPIVKKLVSYVRPNDEIATSMYARALQMLHAGVERDALVVLQMLGTMLGVTVGKPVLAKADGAMVVPLVAFFDVATVVDGRVLGYCCYSDHHWSPEPTEGAQCFKVVLTNAPRVPYMVGENAALRRLWFADAQRRTEFTAESDKRCTVVSDRGSAKAEEMLAWCRENELVGDVRTIVDIGVAPGGSALYHKGEADRLVAIHYRGRNCLALTRSVKEQLTVGNSSLVTLNAIPSNAHSFEPTLEVIPDDTDYIYCDIGSAAITSADDQSVAATFVMRLFDSICTDRRLGRATVVCKLFAGAVLARFLTERPSLVVWKPASSRVRNLELYVVRPTRTFVYACPRDAMLLVLAMANDHMRGIMSGEAVMPGAGVLRPSSMRPQPSTATVPGCGYLAVPRLVAHSGPKYDLERRLRTERVVMATVPALYVLNYFSPVEERRNNVIGDYVDVVSMLQHYYDRVLPGCSLCDGRNDPALIAQGPLTLDCENKLTVNRLKLMANNTTPHVVYESALRTAANYRRRNTTIETLIALGKRNFDVQMTAAMGNLDAVVARALTAVIDKFCRPGAMDQIAEFVSNPVAYDVQGVNEWITRTDGKKVVTHVQKDLELHPSDIGQFEFMLKTAPKVRADVTAPATYQKLQTICAHPVSATSLFSPIFGAMVKRFQSLLLPSVVVAIGYSVAELEAVASAFHSTSGEEGYVELDLSSFDKSQQELAHMVKMAWYRALGMPECLLTLWDHYHRLTYNRGISAGVAFWTSYQHKSGDASTAFGNTLVTMTATADIVRPERFDSAFFIGDDVVICGCAAPVTVSKLDTFQTRYNIAAKLVTAGHGYFCGHFLVPCSDGCIRFVADPIKRLEKLGRRDVLGPDHLEEVRISTMDLTRHYLDIEVARNMLSLVRSRYAFPVDTLFLLPLIHSTVHNTGKFSELFKVVLNKRDARWSSKSKNRSAPTATISTGPVSDRSPTGSEQ